MEIIPKSLAKEFEGGGTWFMTEEQYLKYAKGKNIVGRPDGQFMISSKAANELLSKTGGNSSKMAELLGTDWLQGQKLMRVDVTNPLNYGPRLPNIRMSGANSKFISGGKTVGKISEIATDRIPAAEVGITPVH